jgi:PilZ domain
MRHAEENRSTAFLDAIKVPAAGFAPGAKVNYAEVTYTVIEAPVTDTKERRLEPRRRTRLRSGKVLDAKNKFLIECQVHDRSDRGARLRLVANVSAPARIHLFDDEANCVREAQVIWRSKQDVGVTFVGHAKVGGMRPVDRNALAAKFYAV